MLLSIPESTIHTMDVLKIVETLFQEYPDVILFLIGRISTITDEGSINEKRKDFIEVNRKLITGELNTDDQKEMITFIRKEKEEFRNEVMKYIQIEENKKILVWKEYFLSSQDKAEAENLIMDL